jgi:tetratricopeptide (TPR) repeat protein
VRDLIQTRIAGLDDEDAALLDLASCCGFEFDPLLVAHALGREELPVLERLGRIERRQGLVRSAGRRCVFDHHQVQEVLYEGMSDLLRERYHAALANALEARGSVADGAAAADLCRHYFLGAEHARGLPYLGSALDHLEAGYLNDQAVALVDQALAVPGLLEATPRVDLLLRKAARLELLGRREAEREALEEARGIESSARVLSALGWQLCLVGANEEAHEVLAEALDKARASGDRRIEGRTLTHEGSVCFREGRYEEAASIFDRALAIAREVGDRDGEANALGGLGVVRHDQGRYEESLAHNLEWLACVRELGVRHREIEVSGNLGNVYASMGRQEDARAYHARCLALAKETGNRPAESMATGNLAIFHMDQGRLDQAREHHERSLALARETGEPRAEVVGLYNLASVWRCCGQPDRARRRALEADRLAAKINFELIRALTPLTLAEIAEQQGDREEATPRFADAVANLRRLGLRDLLATALDGAGVSATRDGRTEEARAHFTEAFEIATRTGAPAPAVLAASHLALIPGGNVQTALESLSTHGAQLDHQERMDVSFALWKATGNRDHLLDAHQRLLYLQEHAPEGCRDSIIEAVPLNRELMHAWERHGGEG